MRRTVRPRHVWWNGLAAALTLVSCAVDEDDDGQSTAQICAQLDDASMLGPDQVGASDVLTAAARDAPNEVRRALTVLATTASEIEALDPTAPDTANQVAILLTDPDVASSQSTVRGWLSANCADG